MNQIGIKPQLSRIQTIMTRGGEPAANLKEAAEVLRGSAVFELGADLSLQALERSGIHRKMALDVAAAAFGLRPDQVLLQVADLGRALEARVRGVPGNWEPLGAGPGRTFLVQGDITSPELRADLIVIPQKPRGARGGVAGAMTNFAQEAGGALGAAYLKALDAFDSLVNRSAAKRLPPGTTFSARLGLDSAEGAPKAFLHSVTAPLDEKFGLRDPQVSRDDRLLNYGDKIDRIVLQLQQELALDPDLKRVVLPIIGTGQGLPMVTFGEAASVLRERIAAFQREYPEVEVLFVSQNVGRDPGYAADLKEFSEVYSGQRNDVAPPKATDARLMLQAAVAAHARPVQGQATLNDQLVEQKLDAWTEQFLGALKPLEKDPAGLNDRATGRAFLKGADREAFSMLHKALELPSLRSEILGGRKADRMDPHPVSLDDLRQALAQPALREAVKNLLRSELPQVYGRDGAFSGEQDMGQLLAGALGSHLLGVLNARHDQIGAGLNAQLREAQEAVDRIAQRLELSEAQLGGLRQQNANLTTKMKELEQHLVTAQSDGQRSRLDAQSAKDELALLRRSLADERSAVMARREQAAAFPAARSGGY